MSSYASFDIGEKNLAFYVGNADYCLYWERVDVTRGKRKYTVIESCDAITRSVLLPHVEDLWSRCDVVIIEQQMTRNVRAQRVMQHIWTWFRTTFPLKRVEIIPSTLKTRFFMTTKTTNRKKWAIEKTREILNERNPSALQRIDDMQRRHKVDDICDAYLQMYVYILLNTSS